MKTYSVELIQNTNDVKGAHKLKLAYHQSKLLHLGLFVSYVDHLSVSLRGSDPLYQQFELLVSFEGTAAPSSSHNRHFLVCIHSSTFETSHSLVYLSSDSFFRILIVFCRHFAKISCVNSHQNRFRSLFLRYQRFQLFIFEGVRIATVVTEASRSIDYHSLVIVQLLTEEFGDYCLGENRKKYFFLNTTVSEHTSSQLFICKIDHYTFPSIVFYCFVLNVQNFHSTKRHLSVHFCTIHEVSVSIFGTLQSYVSFQVRIVFDYVLEISHKALEFFPSDFIPFSVQFIIPDSHKLPKMYAIFVHLSRQYSQKHTSQNEKHLHSTQKSDFLYATDQYSDIKLDLFDVTVCHLDHHRHRYAPEIIVFDLGQVLKVIDFAESEVVKNKIHDFVLIVMVTKFPQTLLQGLIVFHSSRSQQQKGRADQFMILFLFNYDN